MQNAMDKRIKYLLEKEQIAGLDKGERFELQQSMGETIC